MENRKYAFTWSMVGDADLGRPNLGAMVRVEAHRLVLYSLRDLLEEKLGTNQCDELYKEVGKRTGTTFYELCCGHTSTFEDFTESLIYAFRYMGIGMFEIEAVGIGAWSFLVTISEDLARSGVEDMSNNSCIYYEGFLAGLFEAFAHMEFDVQTLHCWTRTESACRFSVEAIIPTE
ncbi:MAG: 4-vinyl reductase [Bilophila sp.]